MLIGTSVAGGGLTYPALRLAQSPAIKDMFTSMAAQFAWKYTISLHTARIICRTEYFIAYQQRRHGIPPITVRLEAD
jgi:hypothetical protein